MFRTGLGFDIHRLKEGDSFPLAGVKIRGKEVIAHSDGDCLLHALSNAILSAMGKEDIGTYFPDTEKETEGLDSRKILSFCLKRRVEEGYHLSNIAVTILLEKPKLLPYKEERKKNLALLLNLSVSDIGIRANTFEGRGSVGEEKAICCLVTVAREK